MFKDCKTQLTSHYISNTSSIFESQQFFAPQHFQLTSFSNHIYFQITSFSNHIDFQISSISNHTTFKSFKSDQCFKPSISNHVDFKSHSFSKKSFLNACFGLGHLPHGLHPVLQHDRLSGLDHATLHAGLNTNKQIKIQHGLNVAYFSSS
jgi:hypothetical protein